MLPRYNHTQVTSARVWERGGGGGGIPKYLWPESPLIAPYWEIQKSNLHLVVQALGYTVSVFISTNNL